MNILILCTYPISNPRHGGQLRVKNIADNYLSAKHHVEVKGVLGGESYEKQDGFLPFPGTKAIAGVLEDYFLMEDVAIGELFTRDEYYQKLASTVTTTPDIIHIEHPWLFAFAKRLQKDKCPSAKLVYSSHNIEHQLKQQIIATHAGTEAAKRASEHVEKLELRAIQDADAIICVSEIDLTWLKSKTKKPIVLAPNGVKAWRTSDEGRNEASKITQGKPYALYCASAHPPNMTGFFAMFSGGFGSLKPDEKLVVAGSASWAIAGDARIHQSAKLAERFVIAGVVEQPCLEGLLDNAQCIVLPITQGGGTNLKTAEALWAGKYIVATQIAMRGFEPFIGSQGVFMANDASEFKQALRRAMNSPQLKLTLEEMNARRSVLWESCLAPLLDLPKLLHNKENA